MSEGKTDPIYNAHTYHTKVPYKAIVRAIGHYTQPGDLILGQLLRVRDYRRRSPANCHSRFRIESFHRLVVWRIAGLDAIEWGRRDVIVNDLSLAATFIAANYNCPPDHSAFNETITEILADIHGELDWIYTTQHTKQVTGRIEFTVWSEVFSCSQCSKEVVFFDVALDHETQRVLGEFPCPHCSSVLTKDRLDRTFETIAVPGTDDTVKRVKLKRVWRLWNDAPWGGI